MRADIVPSGLSTVIRMTKVRPSSVTLRPPETAPMAERRRGSLSSAGRLVRAGWAVTGCGLGVGASKVEMPVDHSSRSGAKAESMKPGGLVPLKSGLLARPSLSTTRPIRNSDWMTSSSLWMAPRFIVSTPDRAASVLTTLKVRVSSSRRAEALYIGVAWAMINAISATATRPQPTISALRRLSRRSHSHSSLGASPGRTGARAPGSDAGTIRFMAPSSTICSALGNDPIPRNSATSILAATPTNDTGHAFEAGLVDHSSSSGPTPPSPRNAFAYANAPGPDQSRLRPRLRTNARVCG
jgi:hypothetical protein